MNIGKYLLTGLALLILHTTSGCGRSREQARPDDSQTRIGTLADLPFLKTEQSRSVSAENLNGAKGNGGRAVPDTNQVKGPSAAEASQNLGLGWKTHPFVRVNAGQTVTLMDVDGPGVIRHIFMSEGLSRDHVLRIYWDGETTPSVEVPAPDFFAVGHEMFAKVNSQAVIVNPENALHCYWPMPFRHHAWVTLANEGTSDLMLLCYQIDYALTRVPDNTAYFHAQWRRADTAKENPYVILDGVKGKGRYVGTFLAWTQHKRGWFGEGEVKFYLDGDTDYPTICGTGTEDYFGSSYGFPEAVTTAYCGTPLATVDTNDPPNFWSMYRWHIPDPISFDHDLKVTIQALGWKGDKYTRLSDNIASVAYWYQTEPHAPFPPLPPASERHREKTAIEAGTKPMPGYLFDPARATVTDSAGTTFEWRPDCENSYDSGLNLYSGWQAPGKGGDFAAFGKVAIHGAVRSGLIALAHPRGNWLRMEWPIETKPGQALRLTFALTDRALEKSQKAVHVRAELEGGGTDAVALDAELRQLDKIIRIAPTMTGKEKKLIVQLQNEGDEGLNEVYMDSFLF
jgi:hypothetical protein